MPLVSVIIPSYNHEKFVAEAIQSVLDQTFQDFEIVITDDASSDETVKIIEGFTDPRIKFFKHAKNEGACVASNNCIRNSSGKYIAMLSSDDAWYPNKLEVQVNYMEEHPDIAVVFGNVDWINEHGEFALSDGFPYRDVFKVENRSRFEWLNHFFFRGNCLCHPCSLVRRSVYDEVGYLNPAFASIPDFDLWIRICLKYDIHIMDRALIKFRRMSDEVNASGDKVGNRIRNRFENKQLMDDFLQIKNETDLLKVFPEAKKFGKIRTEAIPYIIGQLAVETGLDFKVLWGLEKIYSSLINEDLAKIIEQEYKFTYSDFLRYTKTYDPFYIAVMYPDIQTQPITIDSGRIKRFLSLSKRYVKEVLTIFYKAAK